MLDQLGRHGLFDLTVKTDGDLHIDSHHTIEDTALALGAAFKQALGDKVGIYRFGNCTVPLDESLAQVTVDLSGRPYLVHSEPENMAPMIGAYDTTMTRHILESFVAQAQIALHVHVPYGRNAHHIVECQFKVPRPRPPVRLRARPARRRDPAVDEGRAVTAAPTGTRRPAPASAPCPAAAGPGTAEAAEADGGRGDRAVRRPDRRRPLPGRRRLLLHQAEDAQEPHRPPGRRLRALPDRGRPADPGTLGVSTA